MTLAGEILKTWAEFGVLDVILPFILSFTIVFALLQKTKVLGIDKRGNPKTNINSMVAFVLGFLVVASLQLTNAIQKIAQYSAIAIIGFVCLFIISGLFGNNLHEGGHKKFGWILALLAIAIIAIYSLGAKGILSWLRIESTIIPVIISFAILILIVWFVVGGGEKETATAQPASQNTPERRTERESDKRKRLEKLLKTAGLSEEALEGASTEQLEEAYKELVEQALRQPPRRRR